MLDQEAVALVTERDAVQIASLGKALAHPVRIKIIAFLLSRPGCIGGDIVDQIGLEQSTVSEHLRILKSSGLIHGTIEYPRICYSLNPEALTPIGVLIDSIAARSQDGAVDFCLTPVVSVPGGAMR